MNISVITENDGWIYARFIEAMRQYSKNKILINSPTADVYFYLPYYLLPKPKHIKRPCCVWLSHQESKSPLREKFISAAEQADFSISHSEKYFLLIKKYGINTVKQVIPGVDLNLFKLRSSMRLGDTDKLIVGYSGRSYQSSARKNPALLKKISEMPFIEFHSTDGKMELEDLPELYANADLMVSPSLVEGGCMAIQESLAVGTPIMVFEDVGVAGEFNKGVIKVPFNDGNEFIARLKSLWRSKSFMHYREKNIMEEMRGQVKNQTWEIFTRKLDKIFEEVKFTWDQK